MERRAGLPFRTPSHRHLAVLAICVTLTRVLFIADRSFFNISPDGPAALGVARWISGTGNWHMFDQSTWRPGYSLLLSPLFFLTSDSGALIRSALLMNAILGGLSAAVLAVLITRLTTSNVQSVLWISAAVAMSPAAVASSAYVWAESAVTLCFLLATLWAIRFYDTRASSAGFAAVVTALVGATIHARLLPLLGTVTILVAGRSLADRHFGRTAAFASVAGVGAAISTVFANAVVDGVWSSPNDANTVSATLSRLNRVGGIADALVGQLWYQLAASASIAGVGVMAIVRAARGSDRLAIDARLLITLTVPMVCLSVVFNAGRTRPDQFIYGRYNDAVVWPLLAVGAIALLRLGRERSMPELRRLVVPSAVATLVLGLVVTVRHGDALSQSRGLAPMIPGVLAVGGRSLGIDVARVTLVSLAALGLVLGATWRASFVRWLLPVVVIVLSSTAVLRTHEALAVRLNGGSDSAAAAVEISELVPSGATIGFRFVPDDLRPAVPSAQQLAYAVFYEWALPAYEFAADTPDDRVGAYVFAPVNEPFFSRDGSTVIWSDPHSNMVLWMTGDSP